MGKVLYSFVLGIFLAYILIFVSSVFFPDVYDKVLGRPVFVVEALLSYSEQDARYPPAVWFKADDRKGVTSYYPEKSYGAYTLFTSLQHQKAFLIDMEGNIVHEWAKTFREIWPNPPHVKPHEIMVERWRRVETDKDGNVTVVFAGLDTGVWGLGLAKLDKDSNVIWTYDNRVHHDFDYNGQGQLVTLTHEIVGEGHPMEICLERSSPYLRHFDVDHMTDEDLCVKPPYLEDFLVVLDGKTGREMKKISLLKAMARSGLKEPLYALSQILSDSFGGSNADFLHPNSVHFIGDQEAGKAPMLVEGHILVSNRTNGSLLIVDPETEKVTWMTYGSWRRQHDAETLPDGSIMLFDNDGGVRGGLSSRVLRFNPQTHEVLWEYDGAPDNEFYSVHSSSQQFLPNGNVLVTVSMEGRLFEVTPEGDVVWGYITPWRNEKAEAAAIFSGTRYTYDDINFLKLRTP